MFLEFLMFLFITHPTNIYLYLFELLCASIVLDIKDVSVNKTDKNV